MVWLADDARGGFEVMLVLPREQPQDAAALAAWLERARQAARLDIRTSLPWRRSASTTIGRMSSSPAVRESRSANGSARIHPGRREIGGWLCDALLGLAYAHEAGVVQWRRATPEPARRRTRPVRVMALGALAGRRASVPTARGAGESRNGNGPGAAARPARGCAERDVLACGVLLHHLLAGEPALGLADTGQVIARLTPLGRDTLRLPWTTPLPVPEALRAIANRATSAQERLRYRGARTLLGALGGWLAAESQDDGGPVALLLDRLHTVGHLPALPGLGARVARVLASEGRHTDAIAGQILPDLALSFELLRTSTPRRCRAPRCRATAPVLTLRRIVALIGVNGVRKAANSLRAWPGALDDAGRPALKKTMERIRLAGHVAQAPAPARLRRRGRLSHHRDAEPRPCAGPLSLRRRGRADRPPDAAAGGLAGRAGAPEPQGMSEDAAAYAVLGVDIAAFGFAVARQWGLGDEVLHMIRRLPPTRRCASPTATPTCCASSAAPPTRPSTP